MMTKRLAFLALLLASFCTFAQRGIELALMRTHIVELESYLVNGRFESPNQEGDRFVEIQLQVRNRSSNRAKLDLSDIRIQVKGETYAPLFILANTSEPSPIVSVPTLEAAVRKLLYSVPGSFKREDIELQSDYTTYSWDPFTAAHTYFDDKWTQLPGPQAATYYRRSAGTDHSWIVRNYFSSNDQVQMETEAAQVFPLKKQGLTTWYYENGHIQEQGFHIDDVRKGTFLQFHSNGVRKSRITYTGDDTFYDQFWDPEGRALLDEGSGQVDEINARGNRQVSLYQDHGLKRVMEIRDGKGDTLYSKTDKTPEYKRGINFLYQFVAINIKYPKEARKKGVEGKVFVGFVVDERGRVSEVSTLRGIGYGCDEEAERVLNQANNWIPGEVNGEAVKSFVVIPVVFKLT